MPLSERRLPTSLPPSVQLPLFFRPERESEGSETEREFTHTEPTDRLRTERKETTRRCHAQSPVLFSQRFTLQLRGTLDLDSLPTETIRDDLSIIQVQSF